MTEQHGGWTVPDGPIPPPAPLPAPAPFPTSAPLPAPAALPAPGWPSATYAPASYHAPAPYPAQAPPLYRPPAPPPRRRTGLLVVLLVLAALVTVGLGSAGGWYLAHRSAAASAPTDSDRRAAMEQLVHQLGAPDGFSSLPTNWNGPALEAYYQVMCDETGSVCPVDVPVVVSTWAQAAGDAEFTQAYVRSCTPGQPLTGSFHRAGMSVHLLLSEDGATEMWYTLQVTVSPS